MKGKVMVLGILLILISVSTGKGIIVEKFFDIDIEKDEIFEKLITKIMKIAHMSALSAAIIKNNEVVWSKGFGIYDRENEKEATNETIYLVASISKTITATALLQLYEKGLFDLDDDVNKYLPFSLRNPNYPDKPITFRMLLAHQSSLAVDPPAFYVYLPGDLEVKGYPYPWLKEYLVPGEIHYKPQVWSNTMPGEEMNYANVGYALLGYLVELISGEPFEEYCKEHIFKPLGMNDTSFRLKDLNISKIAVPYVVRYGEYYPLLHYSILDNAAGGLRTNVLDLSRFLIAHMNGGVYNGVRILREETVEEMHRIQYPSNKYGFQYGLGWQIWKIGGQTYIGHTGGLYGVATNMRFRTSDKVGIIFFTNKEIYNVREIIAFSLIERLLFWKADKLKGFNIAELKETVIANKELLAHMADDFNVMGFVNELNRLV